MLNQNLLLAGDDGYNLSKSLRFRSSASAYLSRTPASAGNRKTWTWSGWVKRGSLGSRQSLLYCITGTTDSTFLILGFDSSDRFEASGYITQFRTSTAVYRDPSAWYHIVIAFDTTQATANNRLRIYVNNLEITAWTTNNAFSQNTDYAVNQNTQHIIGGGGYLPFDGYLADTYLIDGQSLTPSSFGEFDLTTGVWQPKKYAGTYGTNGFYLPFSDNTSTTTLGYDKSGNSNNWTTNNISLTAGSTYDSMVDVPTMSALGSNYAVLNPLDRTNGTTANANLQFTYTSTSQGASIRSTVGMSSGKWYCEVMMSSFGGNNPMCGIIGIGENLGSTVDAYVGKYTTGYAYNLGNGTGTSGYKFNNTSGSAYGASTAANDIIGITFDADVGTLTFYKNNVSQGVAYSSIPSGTYCFAVSSLFSTVIDVNFGQRPFSYTPPTGFVALNTFNLPEPTIKAGNKHFDATIYTGTGSSQNIVNSGSMQPDLVWLKIRSSADSHTVTDSVRGISGTGSPVLFPNTTGAESTFTGFGVSALNSNGFTLIGNGGLSNASGSTYVGWQWRASNTTPVTNTAGSISAQVSANASAGFSIVTYTGTGANATVGHGLGVAPKMVIIKGRSNTYDWVAFHERLNNGSSPWNYALFLNQTLAQSAYAGMNNTAPTSTVFSLGGNLGVNASGGTYVAYCFSEVAGYSKFGSYTGNSSADGAFVYTGFRPRYLMLKRTDTAGYDWFVLDSARNTYNAVNNYLYPDLSNAEGSAFTVCDFLSNGFKFRDNRADWNGSGATYIYAAFAENPFKYSLAR